MCTGDLCAKFFPDKPYGISHILHVAHCNMRTSMVYHSCLRNSMKLYIVGNPLVKNDSTPIALMPQLYRTFPTFDIEEIDPNEDFIPQKGSIIIDTVDGIDAVRIFTSIDQFIQTKSVSAHDYDLGFHLALLSKLGKLPDIRIIGVPMNQQPSDILKDLVTMLRSIV